MVVQVKSKKKKIQLDFDDLCEALDSSDDCFINLKTGEVVCISDEFTTLDDSFTDELTRIRADGRTYKELDPFPSNVAFGIMEEFVTKLDNKSPAKAHLTKALRGGRPFRKFKDVLNGFPEVRSQWFAFKREEMMYWAPWWIRKNSIEAEVVGMEANEPESAALAPDNMVKN